MKTYIVHVVSLLLLCAEIIDVSCQGTAPSECMTSGALGDFQEPTIVSQLGVCTDILGDTPQCCSHDYIRLGQRASASIAITESLMDEVIFRLDRTVRFYLDLQGDTSFQTPFVNRYFSCVFNKFNPFQITNEAAISELSGQLTTIITCVTTTQCPSLLEEFLNMVETQLENSLINFLNASIDFNLIPNDGTCIAEIVTEVFFTEEVRQRHYDLLDNIRRTVANVAGKVLYDISVYEVNLAGFSPLDECITSLLQINTCQRCVFERPDLCTNVCGQITAACFSAMNDRMVNELQLLWDFNRQISTILEDTLEAFTNTFPASINLTEFIEKLDQKLDECGIDFTASELNDIVFQNDSICDFPQLLPDTSLLPVSSADGGLFDYPGRVTPLTCVTRSSTTSEMCWNGEEAILSDVEPFQNYTIAGQRNNPLYIGDDDYIESLESQLAGLGFPFSPLLLNNPDFSSLLPTPPVPVTPSTTVMATSTIRVTLPTVTPSQSLPPQTTLPGNSATSVEAAVLIILLPLLVMLLIIK